MPHDLADAQWAFIGPLLPPLPRRADGRGRFEIQFEATHRRFMDNGESDDGIGVRLGAYW